MTLKIGDVITGLTDAHGTPVKLGDCVRFSYHRVTEDLNGEEVTSMDKDYGVVRISPYSGAYIVGRRDTYGRCYRVGRKRWFEIVDPSTVAGGIPQ